MNSIFKIRKISADYKRLLSNFFSLSVLQGLNYLFPLITMPYLTRVLGMDKYGLVSYAAVIISYFQMVTDYGFNLSATKDI
jgi:PST family polysaccharide transporter